MNEAISSFGNKDIMEFITNQHYDKIQEREESDD